MPVSANFSASLRRRLAGAVEREPGGRLMHRGTLANVPGMMRRSLINHYSGVNHRPDMAKRGVDANGMVFARFEHGLEQGQRSSFFVKKEAKKLFPFSGLAHLVMIP